MKNYVEKGISYSELLKKFDELVEAGKTTGTEQSENRVYFTKLNRHRMKRLDKTVSINDDLKKVVNAINQPLIWLIITESWCGDGAQNIPAIEKIAAENPLIQTRYLLRDENLDLMDQYLTNGGRAIPILICVEGETFQPLGKWGSRPKAIQEYFLQLKSAGVEKTERDELIQRRYNSDKEQSIQADFMELIKSCFNRQFSATV